MAQRKCILCGNTIKEEPVPYKGAYVHQHCFDVAIKAITKNKKETIDNKTATKGKTTKKPKPKIELKDKVNEEDYQLKKRYYEYLRQLIDDDLSAKVYAVTEDYIKRYGFTFESMYNTLVYLNEIIEKELVGDVVGIIPYYHTEAENYYNTLKKIEKVNKDKNINLMYNQTTIHIRPKKSKNKLLDINSI